MLAVGVKEGEKGLGFQGFRVWADGLWGFMLKFLVVELLN